MKGLDKVKEAKQMTKQKTIREIVCSLDYTMYNCEKDGLDCSRKQVCDISVCVFNCKNLHNKMLVNEEYFHRKNLIESGIKEFCEELKKYSCGICPYINKNCAKCSCKNISIECLDKELQDIENL